MAGNRQHSVDLREGVVEVSDLAARLFGGGIDEVVVVCQFGGVVLLLGPLANERATVRRQGAIEGADR